MPGRHRHSPLNRRGAGGDHEAQLHHPCGQGTVLGRHNAILQGNRHKGKRRPLHREGARHLKRHARQRLQVALHPGRDCRVAPVNQPVQPLPLIPRGAGGGHRPDRALHRPLRRSRADGISPVERPRQRLPAHIHAARHP